MSFPDDVWLVWSDLSRLESRLAWNGEPLVGRKLFDSMGRSVLDGARTGWAAWDEQKSRVERVREALRASGPAAKDLALRRLAGIDLSVIWDVLISVCEDIALYYGGTVLAGAAIGGFAGAFAFGIGALPGAAAGAAVGSEVGGVVMTALGLKSLIEGVVQGADEALDCYSRGFREAWGPTAHDRRFDLAKLHTGGGDPRIAAEYLAEGHLIVVIGVLSALVAFLTRGKGDRAMMLAEVESSRLGPRVAQWMVQHEEQLIANPALRPRGRVSVAAQEGSSVRGGGRPPREPREPRPALLPQKQVPCFHPFDKKKFKQLSEQEHKEYLKDYAKQLEGQQKEINALTANQYKAERDAFEAARKAAGGKSPRNPAAAGLQEDFRNRMTDKIEQSIGDSLFGKGKGLKEAEEMAAERTNDLMSKSEVLHEPDGVAGGWSRAAPARLGRADVNASIGASWNRGGRLDAMDDAAEKAINTGRGNETMNVKLEVCRGKGLR